MPILRSYQGVTGAIRAHALDRASERAAADRAMDELVETSGAAGAWAIVRRLPDAWSVRTERLDVPWRETEAAAGSFRIGGGIAVVIAAVALIAGTSLEMGAGAADRNAWFVLLGAAPVLLALAAWLVVSGRRHRRVARGGIGGEGVVIGKSPRLFGSRQSRSYGLVVEAELRDTRGEVWSAHAISDLSFGSNEADAWKGKPVRLLWSPAHPQLAIVAPRPR